MEHSNSLFTVVVAFETFYHLEEVPQTCSWEQIGQDVIDRAIQDTFSSDCRSLLQPVDDTLSTALTNVLVLHIHYHTSVFLVEILNLDNESK